MNLPFLRTCFTKLRINAHIFCVVELFQVTMVGGKVCDLLCSFTNTYQRFEGTCYLLFQGRRSDLSAIKMEVAGSSETFVRMYQRVRLHIPPGRTHNIHHLETLRSIFISF
jgi:hypothetical protein